MKSVFVKYAFLGLLATPALAAAPVEGVKTIVGPNGAVVMKIATASLDNSGGSTCAVNSGAWVGSNPTENGTGDCTWDITGVFSSAPICTLTPYDNGTATLVAYHKAPPSSTALRIQTASDNNTAVNIGVVNVICIGD